MANLAVYNGILRSSWWPNIMQQAMIRAETKLTFAWGIASRMAEAINASLPPALQMLGEIWTFAQFARSAMRAAEVDAREYGNGVWFPAVEPLIALRASLPRWFPRVNEIIRELGSHNLLTTPTAAQFADPALRPLLDEMLAGVRRCQRGGPGAHLPPGVGLCRQRVGQPERTVRAVLYWIGAAQPDARATTR